MKKLLAMLLVLIMLVSLFAGCGNAETPAGDASNDTPNAGSSDSADELVTIRVSTLAQQLSIPMHYIQKMGWDVENGFKLEITTFSQGTGINEALGSGLVDVFTIGAAGISSCCVYDAVYLFSHEDSGAGQNTYVRADSEIAKHKGTIEGYPDVYGTPETIKGSTILLPMGTGAQIEVDTYLEIFGLTEDDVTMVNMDTAATYQAFVSGEGDFAHSAYPTSDEYNSEDYVLAFSMNTLGVPYYDNILCSRAFYEDESKHDALVALCVQLLRVADAFQDEEVLMDTMLEWYEINGQSCDPDAIEHQVLERPFFTYEDLKTIDYAASFKMTAEFYASIGNISEEDLEKVLENMDSTIINEALAAYEAEYVK